MASRRTNLRKSERIRNRAGDVSVERIRSGDVSEALTEVLREETRLPRASPREGKDLEGKNSAACIKSSSPTGSEGRDPPPKKAKMNGANQSCVAHLVRYFKTAGCPLPSLQNMMGREAYVKMDVAHAKSMEANNEFAATLERRLQDVPCSDEVYEIKTVVRELKLGLKMAQDRERTNTVQLAAAEKLGNQAASLEAPLRVVSNERKSALEQVSFLEANVESSANKFYDAKRALADSYLDVLVSLKEKWEKKKAASDCKARLREVKANIDILKEIMNNKLLASDELLRLLTKEVELGSELDVMAVSDFSVEKLDLPQITEDLPENFFAKVPSAVNDTSDEMKRADGQFEDGEFNIEDFAVLVGGAGCNQRLDQGPGLQSTVKNIAIFGYRKSNELELRGFADSGHLLLSLEVGDFPKGRPCIWVVSSNTMRSSFIEVLQCSDCYRNVDAYSSFGLSLDSVCGVVPRACPIGSPNPVCWTVLAADGVRFSEVSPVPISSRPLSSFTEACSAAEVVMSSLPCSVRIERSGSLDLEVGSPKWLLEVQIRSTKDVTGWSIWSEIDCKT
ncbi:hypothetical protein F2Q69_00023445 [Brassica cretica]|uniref:Uncharacterized protein n=1 Tax=Brassica cretica TaxID=69181 RepID=A0A8S9QPZ3_BRACR|nr:hypothetical protein F2Q69_00023445 [Brassica cretica]